MLVLRRRREIYEFSITGYVAGVKVVSCAGVSERFATTIVTRDFESVYLIAS